MPPLLQAPMRRPSIPGIPTGGWDLIAGPGISFGTQATAGTLGDGRIIVSGTTTHTLDPDTLLWTTQPTAANEQTFGSGSVNENGDYVFAGGSENMNTSIFNQGTNTWAVTNARSDVTKLLSAGQTSANGLVYVMGGTENGVTPIASMYTFNSGTEVWAQVVGDDHPQGAFYLAATTMADGNIITAGGELGSDTQTDRAFIYDIGTTTWSEINTMPLTTAQNTLVVMPNGLVWSVGGGISGLNSYVYDVGTGLWTTGPAVPGAMSTGAYMTGIFPDGRVIVTTSSNTWVSIAT